MYIICFIHDLSFQVRIPIIILKANCFVLLLNTHMCACTAYVNQQICYLLVILLTLSYIFKSHIANQYNVTISCLSFRTMYLASMKATRWLFSTEQISWFSCSIGIHPTATPTTRQESTYPGSILLLCTRVYTY